MFIKPFPGLSIRDPDRGDRVPAEGRDVPESAYWRRRLAERSVVIVAAETAAPEMPSETASKRARGAEAKE